jgi:hypothetical protein
VSFVYVNLNPNVPVGDPCVSLHSCFILAPSGEWDCSASMPNSSYKLHYMMIALGNCQQERGAYEHYHDDYNAHILMQIYDTTYMILFFYIETSGH